MRCSCLVQRLTDSRERSKATRRFLQCCWRVRSRLPLLQLIQNQSPLDTARLIPKGSANIASISGDLSQSPTFIFFLTFAPTKCTCTPYATRGPHHEAEQKRLLSMIVGGNCRASVGIARQQMLARTPVPTLVSANVFLDRPSIISAVDNFIEEASCCSSHRFIRNVRLP